MTATAKPGRRAAARVTYRHPVNQELYGRASLGARIADIVTTFIGSWKFLVIQTIVVAIWIAGNIILLFHFDPFPFILLNLAFSTQAAYAAPLILLAGNRQSVHDRMTLEHAATQSDVEEQQNEHLLRDDKEILEHVAALEQRIIELEEKILAEIRGSGGKPAG
jgi:Predicted membrane protein